ncbi:MAG: M48 family metalloprotease [Lentisphaerae bacterium]|nr:M48 family metalloprotease [Lentisphaerota bacterium]
MNPLLGGLLLVLFAAACATNPVTKKREFHWLSEGQEKQIGESSYLAYQQAEGGTYEVDPAVASYVKRVGETLWRVSDRPQLPYDIVVLNNSVPNAWALPGGKMAINRGLLTALHSESELAAVLGHEIVHVAARHGAKSVERGTLLQVGLLGIGLAAQDRDYEQIVLAGSGAVAGLTSLTFSRRDELQADKYGIAYMSRAGYDLQAAVTLQELFVKLSSGQDSGWLAGWLSTHPPSPERVEANRLTIAQYATGGLVGRDTYSNAMAHLMATAPAYAKGDEGCKALQQHQADAALALAQEAIAIEPGEALFHGLAAKAYAQKQAWDQALDSLNRAIALNSRYFEYYLSRGQLLHERGQIDAARADLNESIQWLPTASAHYLLGAMDLDDGDSSRAVEHFRAAAESESDEGRKAAVLLAKLELPEHPERYLQVAYALDDKGYLVLIVENGSPVDVSTCEVGLATRDEPSWARQVFPQGVPARRASKLPTRLGPFTSVKAAQDAVRYRFERVAVAGASQAPTPRTSRFW